METMTLTEQALCRLWFRAESTGDWMEMFQELHDIADVMHAAEQDDAAEMFADAAQLALSRRVMDLRMAAPTAKRAAPTQTDAVGAAA